ncbi:MAG: hypothetical protein KOO63_13215 [Bacteroidales bacterium]|nr:hypothetical protein [Candidatus Latescibacterota bacterium]
MKDVIAVSALSFILISMGALYSMGFMRFGPESELEMEAVVPVDQTTINLVQLQAIETQKINLERNKVEMLSIKNDLEMEKKIISDMRLELEDYLRRMSEMSGEIDKEYQEKITRLAKLYDSMKPGKAAPIAASIKMDLLVKIITAMKEKKAAKLMAALPPAVSAEISRRIGKRPTI